MKPSQKTILLAAACALAIASPCAAMEHAGPHARAQVGQLFKQSDADGNGSLSKEEFQAARLAEYGVGFETFDANSDGRITLAEYLALFERYHPSEHQPEL